VSLSRKKQVYSVIPRCSAEKPQCEQLLLERDQRVIDSLIEDKLHPIIIDKTGIAFDKHCILKPNLIQNIFRVFLLSVIFIGLASFRGLKTKKLNQCPENI
jgi:hypothetical protein